MTEPMDIAEADVDLVRELTSIGAGHAATALAALVGLTCEMKVPRVRVLSADRLGQPLVDVIGNAADDQIGVFFEVQGGPGGVLALLFPEASCDLLLTRLTGKPRAELGDELAESALREVGNILASHVASALGDTLGTVVLPSVPVLAMGDAPEALASLLSLRAGEGPVLRVETEICDREQSLHGLLVFVPDDVHRIAPAPGF